jgi:hypothetical protein
MSNERSFCRNDEVIRRFILFWPIAAATFFALMLKSSEALA